MFDLWTERAEVFEKKATRCWIMCLEHQNQKQIFQFSFPSKLHDMQVAFELSRFLSKIYLFKSWIEALTHNITYILAWIHQIMYIQYMFSLYTRMNSCKMLGRILDAQGNSGAQVALGSWTPLPSLLTLWRWWLQVWQAGNWGAALSLSPQSASVPLCLWTDFFIGGLGVCSLIAGDPILHECHPLARERRVYSGRLASLAFWVDHAEWSRDTGELRWAATLLAHAVAASRGGS